MEADKKRTPLHVAALRGHTEAIKALLAAGAAINAQDDEKKTPLHVAVGMPFGRNHTEAVKLLLAAGACVGLFYLLGL